MLAVSRAWKGTGTICPRSPMTLNRKCYQQRHVGYYLGKIQLTLDALQIHRHICDKAQWLESQLFQACWQRNAPKIQCIRKLLPWDPRLNFDLLFRLQFVSHVFVRPSSARYLWQCAVRGMLPEGIGIANIPYGWAGYQLNNPTKTIFEKLWRTARDLNLLWMHSLAPVQNKTCFTVTVQEIVLLTKTKWKGNLFCVIHIISLTCASLNWPFPSRATLAVLSIAKEGFLFNLGPIARPPKNGNLWMCILWFCSAAGYTRWLLPSQAELSMYI